jgi:hypothetical protein
MGAGSEWIEASSGENNCSCEAQTNNLSRREKKNCGSRTPTLGKVPGGEEKGCLGQALPRLHFGKTAETSKNALRLVAANH